MRVLALFLALVMQEPPAPEPVSVLQPANPTYDWTIKDLRLSDRASNIFDDLDEATWVFGMKVALQLVVVFEGKEVPYEEEVLVDDLFPTLRALRLSRLSELRGKAFQSRFRIADYALDEWRVKNIWGDSYRSFTSEEVDAMLVKSFSQMGCPDFKLFDRGTVVERFQRIFFGEVLPNGNIVDIEPELWLSELAKKIEASTESKIKLVAITADQYVHDLIRGPSLYFELNSHGIKRQGAITPSVQPVICLPLMP